MKFELLGSIQDEEFGQLLQDTVAFRHIFSNPPNFLKPHRRDSFGPNQRQDDTGLLQRVDGPWACLWRQTMHPAHSGKRKPASNQFLSISLGWNKELSTCLVSWGYATETEQLHSDCSTTPPAGGKSKLHRKCYPTRFADPDLGILKASHDDRNRISKTRALCIIANAICAHNLILLHSHWAGWSASQGWITPCKTHILRL